MSKLAKRSRYYHSQIDMEMLQRGAQYEELADAYVIFICDFDPFGEKKYCYTFESLCSEVEALGLDDGRKSIFLCTSGANDKEVPEELVKFLRFVKADLSESEKDFEDDYVQQLQQTVARIKNSPMMEGNYMQWQEIQEELRREGREEGRIEGRIEGRAEGRAVTVVELLRERGTVSDDLERTIMSEKDISVLQQWAKLAAKVTDIEQFMKEM